MAAEDLNWHVLRGSNLKDGRRVEVDDVITNLSAAEADLLLAKIRPAIVAA